MGVVQFEISSEKATAFLNFALSADLDSIQIGETQATQIHLPTSSYSAVLKKEEANTYILQLPATERHPPPLRGSVLYQMDISHLMLTFRKRYLAPSLSKQSTLQN